MVTSCNIRGKYIVFASTRTQIHFLYNPVLQALIFTCIFCSSFCKSPVQKIDKPLTDSLIISMPVPSAINPAEKMRLSEGCRRWYDSLLDKTAFNGGMLIAKGGNIVFEKYKGSGHINSQDTINANTAFHIASVSKTFTAMAILKLWQENRLNIDEEYNKYFPEFNYPGVTIRTLLNHRSGLPNYLYFMDELGWKQSQYIKNNDVLNYLIQYKSKIKNIESPGRHFNYCNTNYALLALIIEKITGISYPEYIHKEFFLPLQMKHSFVFTMPDSARAIPSYDWRGQLIPMNYLDLVYGDKNIYSTPADLLIWDRALRSKTIFKQVILDQAYMPYSNEKAGLRNYGLGWRMVISPDGKKMIFHNGWWHGNNAVFIRLIEEDATIIVLGNRYTNAIYKAKVLANLFSEKYVVAEEEVPVPVKVLQPLSKK